MKNVPGVAEQSIDIEQIVIVQAHKDIRCMLQMVISNAIMISSMILVLFLMYYLIYIALLGSHCSVSIQHIYSFSSYIIAYNISVYYIIAYTAPSKIDKNNILPANDP